MIFIFLILFSAPSAWADNVTGRIICKQGDIEVNCQTGKPEPRWLYTDQIRGPMVEDCHDKMEAAMRAINGVIEPKDGESHDVWLAPISHNLLELWHQTARDCWSQP